MKQWITLFQKEWLEQWRNLKWVWVPIVFILLSIMDPITTYYMPQIMDSLGGLPEGALFDIPMPSPEEAIMMSLSQLSSLGVLVIILISMGTIAGERNSGVMELILVKPVTHFNYVTAKWAAHLVLILASFTLGMLMSWYYVSLLFGYISFSAFLYLLLFYGLWLIFVVSLTIFYNSFIKKPGMVAFLSIATLMVLSVITQAFGRYMLYSPSQLSQHIHEMLEIGYVQTELIYTSIVTLIMIGLLLILAIKLFQSKERQAS